MQVVYVGDGNNITHSWIRLAAKLNFELVCACPEGFEPDSATMDLVNNGGAGKASISHDVYDVNPQSYVFSPELLVYYLPYSGHGLHILHTFYILPPSCHLGVIISDGMSR